MMRLGELLSGTPAARWSSAQAREAVIGGLCQDSRSVQRGDLFVGMPGESVDGAVHSSEMRACGGREGG